jgi:large conductance mechanosensitive channel
MEEIMLKEFKEFIMRGNVVDMAVGLIMGASFGTIVTSLVNDIVMPPVGMLLGGIDFSHLVVTLQADPLVTINYGTFINTLITFLVVAVVMFLLVRAANKLKREPSPPEPTTKACNYCFSTIPVKATRCPHCTSQLEAS